MIHRSTIALGVATLTGVVLLTGSAEATPSTGLTTTILAKATFDSTRLAGHGILANGKGWSARLRTHGPTDGYVVDNLIDVGGTTGWHSHPGPSIIFVVKGTITNYDSDAKGCAGQVYEAGTSFADPGGTDVHMLKNNGTVQAETIAVQLLPTGAARKIDKPAPAGCPPS